MKNKNILIITAHADDAVLGMGGTIYELAKDNNVLSYIMCEPNYCARDDERNKGDISVGMQQEREAANVLGYNNRFGVFKDQEMDTRSLLLITKYIETIKEEYKPDFVFTHYQHDLNKDHRIVFEATMTAFRPLPDEKPVSIFSMENVSTTEWSLNERFKPNYYFILNDFIIEQKTTALSKYETEERIYPHPRSFAGIHNLSMIRGQEVGTEYAEAFILIRGFHK